jgi:1-acyl-sn-glycerol-3-phosphate acyltransferase
VLVACKHQSMLETFEIMLMLNQPAVVLKRELAVLPLWGWVVQRYGAIPINRAGGASALRSMMRAAEVAIAEDRPIVIFPEGTRVAPGEQPPLQSGFAGLYRMLKLPVVPVAVDSGRLERGFDLVQRGVSRRMLISGVDRTVRPNELAEAYHVDQRLIDCCVVLGRESFDTRSNADEVANWVERRRVRSIRLVTNELHMPRARYELRKRVGGNLNILQDAVPSEPDYQDVFVEYNKYLLGRIADLIGI